MHSRISGDRKSFPKTKAYIVCLLFLVCIVTTWCIQKTRTPLPLSSPSPHIAPNPSVYIFEICGESQEYVRGTSTLSQQSCIKKGQGIALWSQYILTAKHVVRDVERAYQALHNEDIYRIERIRHHPTKDLALLKIQGIIQNIYPIYNISKDILVSGNNTYLQWAWTTIPWTILDYNYMTYTTDYTLSPTQSGSPLFLEKTQELIGINTAVNTSLGVSYAIAITQSAFTQWLHELALDLSQ